MSIADRTIEFACPKCEAKQEVRLRDISPGKKMTCTGCGVSIEFGGEDVAKGAAELDSAIGRLTRAGDGSEE